MVVVDRCLAASLAGAGGGEILEDECVRHDYFCWRWRLGLLFRYMIEV